MTFFRSRQMVVIGVFVLVSAWPLRITTAADEPAADDLAQFYGFRPVEIFKLEYRSANMLTGDLNGDGLTDVVLVDNSHSRIDLLQQRKEKPAAAAETKEKDVNFLGDDWRFERRKIPVDKQVASMSLGDFNGDGRTDIAYFGVPDRLVVLYQPKEGEWTARESIRLPEVQPVQWILAAGDLNGDKKDDIVVLGRNVTYVLYQQAGGTLGTPERLMNTSDKLGLAQVADLDGDGRNDLCYVASDETGRNLCARLQGADGRLGPELQFDLNKPRSITLANVDGRPGHEILTVDSQTGRVKLLQLKRPAVKSGELASRLIQYGFGDQATGRDRDLAIGDLDGDGLADVVVSDPESAQMIVFRQQAGTGLDLGTTFPGLLGAKQIRMADFNNDKSAEVVVLSEREKTLGISRLEGGRLTFPQSLPVEKEPLALELADLDGDKLPEIVYIGREKDGRSSKYSLHALKRAGQDDWQPQPFGKEKSVSLELRGAPERIMTLDANHDGRPDFLVFPGLGRAPHLFVTSEQGGVEEISSDGGIQIGDVASGAISVGRLDEPALLVAQDKFARNLKLEERKWQVVDQYNAVESGAKIAGVATIDLDGQPGNEIVLVDSGVNKLRVLRKEENLFRPWKEIETGSFPYKSAHVADLNGDGEEDLLLFGSGKFAVLYAGRTDPTVEDLASFETRLEKIFFSDVVAGDLNGDGRTNLVATDTQSHFVEVLDYAAGAGLRHAISFKVFDEKSFTREDTAGSDPRESAIVDVTGDGRADLLLLTHDRLLLYPQDDGQPAPGDASQPASEER